MLTKGNVKIGLEWRFGPDWPGQRCGAKTRRGKGCQRPANKKNGRCRLHGGASTGPRTEEGLKRLVGSKTKHGRFTKSERAKAKARAEQGRIIRRELKELEAWFTDVFGAFEMRCDTYHQSYKSADLQQYQ